MNVLEGYIYLASALLVCYPLIGVVIGHPHFLLINIIQKPEVPWKMEAFAWTRILNGININILLQMINFVRIYVCLCTRICFVGMFLYMQYN